MVTPLMYIFSCMDADYKYVEPVSLADMSAADQQLIRNEAHQLANLIRSDKAVYFEKSETGLDCASVSQSIGYNAIQISNLTAYTLTRLRDCAEKYLQYYRRLQAMGPGSQAESDTLDFSKDDIALYIEGHNDFVYQFVYETMNDKIAFEKRLDKVQDVYKILTRSSTVLNSADIDLDQPEKKARFELQSKMSYWARLWEIDSFRFDGRALEESIKPEDFQTVAREMTQLGFPGFGNPLALFVAFSNNRPGRKVSLEVPEYVITFLQKIILSGGGEL